MIDDGSTTVESTKSSDEAETRPAISPWVAWGVVAGGFLAQMCSCGVQQAYGEWLVYYETKLLPTTSSSKLSLIGSVQVAFTDAFALPAGLLLDRHGSRAACVVGTALIVLSHVLLAFSTQYYQILLTQGVLLGTGEAFLCVVGISYPGAWHPTHRGLATSLAGVGFGCAALLWPIVFHSLLNSAGFRWANLGVALGLLILLSIATFLLRSLPRALLIERSAEATEARTWRVKAKETCNPAFVLLSAAKALGWAGNGPFIVYLPSLALLYVESSLRPYILTIAQVMHVTGRLVGGLIMDRVGILRSYVMAFALTTIVAYSTWLPADSQRTVLIFAVLFGLSSGMWVATADSTVSRVGHDLRLDAGLAMGFCIALHMPGNLASPPLGALLMDYNAHRPYLKPGAFWATLVAIGACLSAVGVVLHRKQMSRRLADDPVIAGSDSPVDIEKEEDKK